MPGFPQDATSKAAMQPKAVVLEQPVVALAGDIDGILSQYHVEIMDRTMTVEAAITAMENEVRQLLG